MNTIKQIEQIGNKKIVTYDNLLKLHWKDFRYIKIIKVLDAILKNHSNGEDPIKFLYKEYFTNKLSSVDIYNKYHKYWPYNNSTKDTFNKIFIKIFKWNLRKPSYITPLKKAKLKKSGLKNSKQQKIQITKEVEKWINTLKRIAKNKSKLDVDKSTLSIMKNNVDKIKYILSNRWYISKDQFNILIKSLQKKFSMWKTSKIIEWILSSEWFDKIKFNKWRISEILKK